MQFLGNMAKLEFRLIVEIDLMLSLNATTAVSELNSNRR